MSDHLHQRLPHPGPEPRARLNRRELLAALATGTVITLGGCSFQGAPEEAQKEAAKELRADGRPRLPPGQHLLTALKPMGGQEGDPDPGNFKLKIHGAVRKPVELDYRQLLELPQTEQQADVHCVTTWSCFDMEWKGVRISDLAELVGVKDSARHVIFEAAHGYTANVLIEEAMSPQAMVAYRLNGAPLPLENGPPVRSLVPDLYFWKSAKWLTGIRFEEKDEPGFWEVRGYHNHADPWKEERYG